MIKYFACCEFYAFSGPIFNVLQPLKFRYSEILTVAIKVELLLQFS